MEDSNPGRELSVSVLITKALDSLWDVARRHYLGVLKLGKTCDVHGRAGRSGPCIMFGPRVVPKVGSRQSA
ncbi:MAG: hypothetical protein QOF66_7665 [Mycobacterium sp.]|jgi:predicted AlkP superfamily pyrophosphatase or phosphodiesterase|nr:hypothetical protein [Mycobacterium sp.]MDT5059299.1 hypothetical protein [Mycobacterium sp.]